MTVKTHFVNENKMYSAVRAHSIPSDNSNANAS